MFSLFLDTRPTTSSHEEDEVSINADRVPPPLLLISSSNSSPQQDVQRFLSTGADIIIGTPGRVEEFLLGKGRGAASAKELDMLVLDEADRCVIPLITYTHTRSSLI